MAKVAYVGIGDDGHIFEMVQKDLASWEIDTWYLPSDEMELWLETNIGKDNYTVWGHGEGCEVHISDESKAALFRMLWCDQEVELRDYLL